MCYIICMTKLVVLYTYMGARVGGGIGGSGVEPPKIFLFFLLHPLFFGGFSAHGFCRWFSNSG
jgi:hypothetical protein